MWHFLIYNLWWKELRQWIYLLKLFYNPSRSIHGEVSALTKINWSQLPLISIFEVSNDFMALHPVLSWSTWVLNYSYLNRLTHSEVRVRTKIFFTKFVFILTTPVTTQTGQTQTQGRTDEQTPSQKRWHLYRAEFKRSRQNMYWKYTYILYKV